MELLNYEYNLSRNIITEKITQSEELIAKAVEKYGEKVEVACSFGKDSMALLHLALKVKPDIPVFTIMTPYKPIETFEYKDQIIKRYNLNIKEYMSKEQLDPDLPKTNPDKCCQIFKVEPTKEAVKNLDAWICGLRNTEGRTRKDYQLIEEKDGLVKINPILNWTELDVWRYIAINSIPVHPFYAKGYRSLGCEPCTTIVSDEAFERDGRWIGTSKCGGECGIHTKSLR